MDQLPKSITGTWCAIMRRSKKLRGFRRVRLSRRGRRPASASTYGGLRGAGGRPGVRKYM